GPAACRAPRPLVRPTTLGTPRPSGRSPIIRRVILPGFVEWALLVAAGLAATPAAPPAVVPRPRCGLAIEFAKTPAPEIERKALDEGRATGGNLFVLTVSWSQARPSPR